MITQHTKYLKYIATIALTLAVVAFISWGYYHFDPSTSAVAPKCIFKLATGYDCPGCGAQRALHALLHGHLKDAIAFNPFIFIAFPTALAFIVVETFRTRWPKLHLMLASPYSATAILTAILAWWLLRNL